MSVPHADLLPRPDVGLGHHLHQPLVRGDQVPGVPHTRVVDQGEGGEETSTPEA